MHQTFNKLHFMTKHTVKLNLIKHNLNLSWQIVQWSLLGISSMSSSGRKPTFQTPSQSLSPGVWYDCRLKIPHTSYTTKHGSDQCPCLGAGQWGIRGCIKHLLFLVFLSIWCFSDLYKHACYRVPSLSEAVNSIPFEVVGMLPNAHGSLHEVIQKMQQGWSQAWYPVNKEMQ